MFVDETNDKNDQYDVGSPDYQADLPDEEREDNYGYEEDKNGITDFDKPITRKTYQRPKDLKWRVICAGVERLIKEKRLKAENVMIWCDWQSSAPHRSSNPGPADHISASDISWRSHPRQPALPSHEQRHAPLL